MSPVVAVMIFVVCSPDLLTCSKAEAWRHAWQSTEACELDRAWVSRQVIPSKPGVVMTSCELFLDEDGRFGEDAADLFHIRLLN